MICMNISIRITANQGNVSAQSEVLIDFDPLHMLGLARGFKCEGDVELNTYLQPGEIYCLACADFKHGR